MKPKKKDKSEVSKVQKTIKEETSEEIELIEKSESVSKKKVIYIEIDDEVTAVFDKVKNVGSKHVYLVVPSRAILFQSVVNLKILKRKAEDDKKKIYLITNDKNGIHLGQKAGIPIYNKDDEGKPALFNTELNDERLKITPLRATINSVEEDSPTRLSERKLSISEILNKSKSNKLIDVTRIERKEKKVEKSKPKFVIVAPNRHALISFVVISLVILMVIVYIALPGVTIFLTPAASVLEKSVNITLADYQKNRAELAIKQNHEIASYPIETTVTKTISNIPTGKKFSEKGVNASGKLTIVNTTDTAWPLIAETRFQNKDGLVFRIKSPVTVPAASASGPGKAEAYVVADQVDANGQVIGERGNIGPDHFFLPGLKESSRSKIYADNKENMTGGVTDYVTYVSAQDLEAAKQRIKDQLIKAASDELNKAVESKSHLTAGEFSYELLQGDQAIKIGEPKITVDSSLVGKEVNEFSVTGELSVKGVYYDKAQMLEILKAELLMKKSPQKELVKVNETSTSYRIFEWDEIRGKVKLTANIKGIEQYVIDPSKEGGARLIEKIKDHIVGTDLSEAKVYIQNLPEVNKVEIKSWPAWAPSIPNIPDNIEFEIRDAVDAK